MRRYYSSGEPAGETDDESDDECELVRVTMRVRVMSSWCSSSESDVSVK